MAQYQDFYIKEIKYSVYTLDENGNKLRLVGCYPCGCMAKDIVEYIHNKYGVSCASFRKITEG